MLDIPLWSRWFKEGASMRNFSIWCCGAMIIASTLSLSTVARAADILSDADATHANGLMLAQRQCSACHAIGKTGDSPRADAPVFRKILSRYDADALEEDLVEGIKLGHPDMPQFKLNAKAVDALVAYLRSIQIENQAGHAAPEKPAN